MSTLKKLILESEDEFNVTPDESWNYIYLKVEDEITPDMWDKTSDAIWDLMDLDLNKTYKIKKFSEGIYNIIFVTLTDKTNKETHESLSSISNALKSPYQIALPNDLVESEDEFDVTPSEEWNQIELGVGDTITPDMWNKTSDAIGDLMDLDLNKTYKIKEFFEDWEGYDGDDDDEYDVTYVVLTDKTNKEIEEPLSLINDTLKPQYRVILHNDLMENEDEFNVTPDEDWSMTYLSPGDTIIGKMWDWEKIIKMINKEHKDDHRAVYQDIELWKQIYDEGVTIKSFEEFEEIPWVKFDRLITWGPSIKFTNNLLNPKYKIPTNDDLVESEDEFNVTPGEEWNVTYLRIGDTITSDMWKDNSKRSPMYILGFEWDQSREEVLVVLEVLYTDYPIQYWDIDFVNERLKPEFQVTDNSNLMENEDEFNVTPGEQWNQIELTMGDTITPDMWKDKTNISIADVPVQIVGWGNEDEDEDENEYGMDVYIMLNTPDGYTYDVDLDILNDVLKPKFRVTIDKDLRENEDEFNVTPNEDWNVTYLQVGDKVTYDMMKDGSQDKKWFGKNKDAYIELIGFENGMYVARIPNPKAGVLSSPYQIVPEWFNEYTLKPQYQLDVPLDNQVDIFAEGEEDEFNVDASEDWNIIELEIGDIITPDMWNPEEIKNGNIYDLIDDPTEPWYIDQISNRDSIWMTTDTGGEVITHLQYVNDMLLPGYRVGEFINESEDEFNVIPDEKTWNPRKLKVGDTFVTSENQSTPFKIVFIGKAGKTRERFDYHEYTDDVDIVLFGLANGRPFYTDEKYLAFSIDYFNDEYGPLNGAYISEFMNEQEDEFTVDAPKEWNVKDLGINSYLDSTNMNGGSSNTRYKIVGFKKDPNDRELVGLIKQVKNEGTRMWYDLSKNPSHWYVDFLNRKLKPGYEIVFGYVAPKQLDESDDEFNITPSVLWNLDLDTPINITITKEFEVTDWNTDTSAISIETTLIKTSVAQLQEESGENYNYDEITVKNITNWINENSEVVIALFDMDGKEEKSWHDVDRDFKPSSNNLDYELVDMDISVEIPESNLNESDEDFNVTPNKTWNTIEVGDIIEPYMWLDPKKTSRYLLVGNYGAGLKLKRVLSKEDETLNPGDEDRWMYNDPNIIQVITDLFNDELKPEYRFNNNLNESDEDFNITPSEDWAVQELGVGDTLDHTNLKMQDLSKKYIIKKIAKFAYWNDVFLDLYKYNSKLKDWEFVKTFSNEISNVNDILKPGFKIQAP